MLVTKAELNGFIIVVELLKATEGNTSMWIDLKRLAEINGIIGQEFELAINFLTRKGLIKGYGAGYTYFISEYGIDEVTTAVRYPDKHTSSFPCVLDMQAILKANGRPILL